MISMDQLTIEATDDDVVGDTVEIFGDGHQSVYDLARAAGVTVSEIMVNIGPRVNRAMV
jgi:alanine racemase